MPTADGDQALWRRRIAESLRLLGADAASADALARADALWLARVLPASALPAAPGSFVGTSPLQSPGKPSKRTRAERNAAAISDAPAPVPPATLTTAASLFVPQPGSAGEQQLAARRVQVPVADALPDRALIERALKPFLRRRLSLTRSAIDADATAEASARASAELMARLPPHAPRGTGQTLVPVLRPATERWFDVVLLAEQDDTMLVFEDTLLELRNLLARHGAFATVRLWRWAASGDKVVVHAPTGVISGPRAMLNAQRPQLVLLLTHGASSHWDGAPLREFVRTLSQRSVFAVLQMLPERAWRFTALGEATERVRGRHRGAPNRLLERLDTWSGVYVERSDGAAVPMLSLHAPALAEWAQWVMAPRLQPHGAVALDAAMPLLLEHPGSTQDDIPPEAQAVPESQRAERLVRDRVLRFRAIASPQAFSLLRLLAAAWVTLPVMRLLLNALPGPRSISALAEVLLSGLLLRESAAGTAVQDMVFEFAPGVREWLHDSLSSEEQRRAGAAMAASRESIRRYVEQKTGLKLKSFDALLLDPRGSEFLPASAKSFVEVSRRLRSLRGAAADGGAALTTQVRSGAGTSTATGELFNFPPLVRDLVARPELEDQLARRIVELNNGQTLVLRAPPGAGARTTLANVLRRPAVRARFSGGIWFGAEPPELVPSDGAAPRLALRIGAAGRRSARGRGDTRVELQWHDDGDVDIGFLDKAQVDGHLRGMGLRPEQIDRLRRVHLGVPALVPLVGVGTTLGIRSWPRASASDLNKRFGTLACRLVDQLSPAQTSGLTEMSVRRPGYLDVAPLPGAELAPRLGWLCPGEGGTADTLHPSVARWFHTWFPDEVSKAHERIVERLFAAAQGGSPSAWAAYARHHLLDHARLAGSGAATRRVLFNRRLLQMLLDGDRSPWLAQLKPLAKKDRRIAEVLGVLQSTDLPTAAIVDAARRPLAPEPPRFASLNLADAIEGGFHGETVRVAILSTGVDATHPELQHLKVLGATTDSHGHGTAVASLIAGYFIGIAPRVQLQSLAPMDNHGAGSTVTFLNAFSEVLAAPPGERADILCLPFGSSAPDRAMHDALQQLAEAGVLLVAAAGNDGLTSTSYPAAFPEVLSASALDAEGLQATYSGDGELWVPGSDLLVARPAGLADPSAEVRQDGEYPAPYSRLSGTSFACAVLCGLAALVAQATGLRGKALREQLLRDAEEGHARFVALAVEPARYSDQRDEYAASASPSQSERPPHTVEQSVATAMPGKDVVILRVADGPELVLHPQTAKDLFESAPTSQPQQPTQQRRSALGGILLSSFQIASAPNDDTADFAASAAVHAIDAQVDPGLYALQRHALAPLKGSGSKRDRISLGAVMKPLLVLIHGNFVDTATTFGKLWTAHPALVQRLFDTFGDHVYAFEHHTLGADSIASLQTLVQALPQGADLVLATHGSGGLIAELLVQMCADPSIEITYGSWSIPPNQRAGLSNLARMVRMRDLHVSRVIRVACPIRGTPLSSMRLDAYLSAVKWALERAAIAVPPPLLALIGEVARRRADPATLPGLAELAPDSPLMHWLHGLHDATAPGSLRVIAGDLSGGTDSVGAWLETLLADSSFGSNNDLVVHTQSMYGGVARAGEMSFLLAPGNAVSHYSYFSNARSATAFVDAILLQEPPGFAPIGPLALAGESADGRR